MAGVNTFDWRLKKPGTHTREVKEVREHLPKDVQDLILEMADEIRGLKQDVHRLKHDLDGLGRVTLNDLIKRAG